jgi:hypothetical protein
MFSRWQKARLRNRRKRKKESKHAAQKAAEAAAFMPLDGMTPVPVQPLCRAEAQVHHLHQGQDSP